jgi:class 3 adenylate cyclase
MLVAILAAAVIGFSRTIGDDEVGGDQRLRQLHVGKRFAKASGGMTQTRKIAAILVTDVVGYSWLAGADEDRTLSRLRGLWRDLIDPAIAAHHGRVVKRTCDGGLIDFRSVVYAVRCAIEVQNGMTERNVGLSPERRIEFASAFIWATWSKRTTAT